MLRLEGVSRTIGSFSLDLDLAVDEGEIVSILGPSGCGKSTILRIISGLEPIDGGKILIGGRDVKGVPAAKRRIGLVFQNYTLFPHMNVSANIAYPLVIRKLSKDAVSGRVADLLSHVGLNGFGSRAVDTLSGGEQQRVAIARALATNPLLLLLDEPFSAIDAPLRSTLKNSIVSLHRSLGLTTLFVTHNREEALAISDRIIVLKNGSVEQVGGPEELFSAPVNKFVAEFAGPANILSVRVISLPEEIGSPDERKLRCRYGGAEFSTTVRAGVSNISPGDIVSICVRPGEIDISEVEGPDSIEAVIDRVEYSGHYRSYECRVGDDTVVAYSNEVHPVASKRYLRFTRTSGLRSNC